MKPRSGWKVLVDPIAIGALLVGLLGFTAAYLENAENRLLNGAPVAIATVTDTNLSQVKGSAYIEVEFVLPDRRTVRTTLKDFYDNPRPKKGARIEVQYRVQGADIYARESGLGLDGSGVRLWMGVGIAACLLAVGIPIGRLLRHRRHVR
ncbi:hypothetical protein [Kribbella deserti]|uniref:DUF3592 domain-containing protein n=1 Tax=Kribbella deserti TaxID=1926257 RepID=A0ABV6QL19_9ACTN